MISGTMHVAAGLPRAKSNRVHSRKWPTKSRCGFRRYSGITSRTIFGQRRMTNDVFPLLFYPRRSAQIRGLVILQCGIRLANPWVD